MNPTVTNIDADPRSLIAADPQGIIVGISKKFTENFGWSKDDLTGEPLTTIIPQKLRDAHNLGFSRFLTTGVPTLLQTALDLEIQTVDGQILKAQHYIWSEESGGGQQFIAEVNPL